MLGHLASGAFAGQQQAQQENDAEQQRQQQIALQVAPMAQNLQNNYNENQQKPWENLAPHLASFAPGSQATILGGLSTPPTGVAPGITGLQKVFPAGTPAGNILGGYGSPTAPTPPTGPQPQWSGGIGAPGTGSFAPPLPPSAPPGAVGGIPATPIAGGMPAPGGAAPTPGQTTFAGPGGKPLTIGPDAKQQQAARSEVARLAAKFGDKDLPAELRATAAALTQQANSQIEAGDLAGARATIGRLQVAEEDVPRQKQIGAAGAGGEIARRYDRKLKEFQTRPLQGAGAYAAVKALREIEREGETFTQGHPDQPTAGMDTLAPYDDRIQEMDAQFNEARTLRSKKDRTPDEDKHLAGLDRGWQGTAQDLQDNLKYGVPPERKGALLTAVRQWLSLQKPEDRTPANVAAQLTAMGAPDMARLVTERGLNLGGAEAEKQTLALVKAMPGFMRAGTRPEALKAYTDSLRVQSTLTGHPISLDPAQLTRMDPATVKGTPQYDAHQRLLLEIDKLRRDRVSETTGTKFQNGVLELGIKQAKLDQLTGKTVDPKLVRSAVVKKMSGLQHDADQAFQEFNKFLTQSAIDQSSFDPEEWVKSGRPDSQLGDSETRRAVGYYRNWRDKVNTASAVFDKYARMKPGDNNTNGSDGKGTKPPAGAAPLADAEIQHVQKAINSGGFDQWLQSPAFQNPATRERVKRAYKQITGHDWVPAR